MKMIVQQGIINKRCTELWLYNTQITSQGALILSNGLYNNKTLIRLYLNDNCIHDQGVHSLSRILSINNSTLKELHLARNGITNKGAQYIAEMLNTNRTLITLNLYGNQIADYGIKYLTHVLTYYNTTLEYLYLSGNNFMTDLSIDYFIGMLQQNRSLKKLHLFNCNLSDKGKTKLREVIQTKTYFTLNI
jgi:Ran GTPase-activating protein (RanGAP) involved in mRNA processing and transport